MTLIAVLIILCAALIVLGFVAPRLSGRAEHKLDTGIERADSKARSHGGFSGRVADRSAKMSRQAVDRSSDAGRGARRRVE